MEQPEYTNKTYGVISLLGEEQARLIEEMLQKKVDPVDYKTYYAELLPSFKEMKEM